MRKILTLDIRKLFDSSRYGKLEKREKYWKYEKILFKRH